MSEQSSSEPTVKCPVDGCDAEKLSRGIYLHVRQSKGGGHGPQGKVPDDLDLDGLETVGSRKVAMDYPARRETEETGRICPYCERTFRGTRGVMIHLGKRAGDGQHPKKPQEEIDAENLTTGPIDENQKTATLIQEQSIAPPSRRGREPDKVDSLEEKIQTVIEEFRHEGKDEVANRLEDILTDA